MRMPMTRRSLAKLRSGTKPCIRRAVGAGKRSVPCVRLPGKREKCQYSVRVPSAEIPDFIHERRSRMGCDVC
jgi:hypothetical protein